MGRRGERDSAARDMSMVSAHGQQFPVSHGHSLTNTGRNSLHQNQEPRQESAALHWPSAPTSTGRLGAQRNSEDHCRSRRSASAPSNERWRNLLWRSAGRGQDSQHRRREAFISTRSARPMRSSTSSAPQLRGGAEVEQFICSPLNVGGGTVTCAHGVLPIPAPATLEMLKGAPIYSRDIQKGADTPTGAAIVKCLRRASDSACHEDRRSGYGAGPVNSAVIQTCCGSAWASWRRQTWRPGIRGNRNKLPFWKRISTI